MSKDVVVIAGDTGGCAYYRSHLLAKNLGFTLFHKGFPVVETNDQYVIHDKRVDDADVIILQRVYSEFFPIWIKDAQDRGQKVIFDIDDNIWDIPHYNICHHEFKPEMLDCIRRTAALSDICTVSTRRLQQYLKNSKINKNAVVIPNMVEKYFNIKHITKPVIGWWGSSTHKGDFTDEIKSLLIRLSNKYRVVFIGYKPIKSNCEFIEWVEPNKLLDTIHDSGINILLAPIKDNLFNRCKSNIKFLEASACGIVTIASDVEAYSDVISHGDTGFLAKSPSDWLKYTELLINDTDYLNKIRFNANNWVKNNLCWITCSNKIKDIYERILV